MGRGGITIAAIVAAIVCVLLASTGPVWAQEDCSASINGQEANGETIEVREDDDAQLIVNVPADSTDYIYLEFFGLRFEMDSGTPDGTQYVWNIPVKTIAVFGVGLYQVTWESKDGDGDLICRMSARIQVVDRSPLLTVAGGFGAGAIVIGLGGLLLSWRVAINEGARWAIKVVGRVKVSEEQEQEQKERRRVLLEPTISVKQTLLGTLWGLLLGGGTLTMLQQTALSPPTVEVALEVLLPLTLLGLISDVATRATRKLFARLMT